MYKFILQANTINELEQKILDEANRIAAGGKVTSCAPSPDEEEEIENESEVSALLPRLDDSSLDSRGVPWLEAVHSSNKQKNKNGSWRTRRGVEPEEVKKAEAQFLGYVNPTTSPRVSPVQSSGTMGGFGNQPSASQIPDRPTVIPAFSTSPVNNPFTPVPTVHPQEVASPFGSTPFGQPVPVFQQPVAAAPLALVAPMAVQAHPAPSAPVTPPPVYAEPIAIPQQAQKPAHSFETFKAGFVMLMSALWESGAINQGWIDSVNKHFAVKEIFDIRNDEAKLHELFNHLVQQAMITAV